MSARSFLLFALVLATFSPSSAQTKNQNKVFPFPYTQEDLPNGLRLVTIPTDAPNLVSVYIVMQTGSRNEVDKGVTGFAHLFEHMMFRGTEKYPPERYQKILSEAGAASNAYTSDDLTVYHTTFSKEDLPQILAMEADRFQNLKYTPEIFKTEAGAVLGEYNKNSSSPNQKLFEVLNDTAFERHTYKHTTMGFLADVKDMPNQYDYSLKFFDRYYRPEYATIVVTGDVNPKQIRSLVDQTFGSWKRGSYHPDIPPEPTQEKPKEAKVDWPLPTLPTIAIAYHAPAYSDTDKSWSALRALARTSFSQTSPLYQKLVVTEQRVDSLSASLGATVDPQLFVVTARVKKASDLDYVRSEILATIKKTQEELVDATRLANLKSRERYQFVLGLDNSDAVADAVAEYVALRRTPDTIDKSFALFATLTAEDLRATARKHLIENNRTIVILTGPPDAKGDAK